MPSPKEYLDGKGEKGKGWEREITMCWWGSIREREMIDLERTFLPVLLVSPGVRSFLIGAPPYPHLHWGLA